MLTISKVKTEEDFRAAQELFGEYTDWCKRNFVKHKLVDPESRALDIFNQEVLGDTYNSDLSYILLGRWNEDIAGCVFLKLLDDDHCEMKRLYVRKEFRDKKIGIELMEELMRHAVSVGFRYLRICSHPQFMGKAVAIYKNYGFYLIPNFIDDKLQAGDVQMEYKLEG